MLGLELQHAYVAENSTTKPFQAHLRSSFAMSHASQEQLIDNWLQNCPLYDYARRRWKAVPREPEREELLYQPIVEIINAILVGFSQAQAEDGQGNIMKRHALDPQPDITILATGGCITDDPDFPESIGYGDAADLFQVKRTEHFGHEEREQTAVYARELFIQQPIAALLAYLSFRRTSSAFCNPDFLVRLVLLGSSFDEREIGFDVSIDWEAGRRKIVVTPPELFDKETRQWEANTTNFDFDFDVEPIPAFTRRTIRSRGTVCWRGFFRDESYIIKQYWRGQGRFCESRFLKSLVDVKGVGQMLTFQDDRETTKSLRGLSPYQPMIPDVGSTQVFDRLLVCVVVREYGASLEYSTCAHQFLCAVRDIVKGHRHSALRLPQENRVLQSDVSPLNLRLAYDHADECGVLIDWDLAKNMDELIAGTAEVIDARTGTQTFQSLRIHYGDKKGLLHRQPIEDLESVFYVMFRDLFCFDAHAKELPTMAAPWLTSTSDEHLAGLKKGFLSDAIDAPVTRFPEDSKVLYPMMEQLREIFDSRSRLMRKATLPYADQVQPLPPYNVAVAEGEYDAFLAPINHTIALLEETGARGPYARPTPATPVVVDDAH
uniref:Fungal-type protein kinase domain-containing protein n=1 Tax=Mycena chlorophos TaxID=658473 RepID=A0ABQ0M1Y7_MYCCL|nr:predicted protein [Mycena chlorophos]